MASIPYFILCPTAILALVSLMRGGDYTKPTENLYWKNAKLDVIIPTWNEQANIAMCLASLENQTFKIRRIVMIDDKSGDNTIAYAKDYLKNSPLNVEIIAREKNVGKTPSIYELCQTDADLLMVLDADTFIFSNDYIEKLVDEFQNPGVASASGRVIPLHEYDFKKFQDEHPRLVDFYAQHPDANYLTKLSRIRRIAKSITNVYRDILYLYLGRFVYQGQRDFCGSIPNTIGCAAIYRRDRLKAVFDKYLPTLGFNLTDAEDTFIGFEFVNTGYRNAVNWEVSAHTHEPQCHRLPRQLFIWSSGFLQTCYYFIPLVFSAFKQVKLLWKKNPLKSGMKDRRVNREAYRQPWGQQHTKKYGRPIGWYILTSALEKTMFPFFLIYMVAHQNWWGLFYTSVAETLLITYVIFLVSSRRTRIKNLFKTILITPVRYYLLVYDIYILANFLKDISFGKSRNWRK